MLLVPSALEVWYSVVDGIIISDIFFKLSAIGKSPDDLPYLLSHKFKQFGCNARAIKLRFHY